MYKIPIRHIHGILEDPNPDGDFNIRDNSVLLLGNEMVQAPHRHDYFYVLCFEKGTGTHTIDFTTYTITDHSIFFMRPGQVHHFQLEAESTGYLMQFSAEFYFPYDKRAGQQLLGAGKKNYFRPEQDRFYKLFSMVINIFQEYTGKQNRYKDVIKAQMSIFLIELIREDQSATLSQASLHTQELLDNFMALLEKHVIDHKQVSDYAKMMNLSAYQLNTVTKSTLGKTCSEVINDQIVLEAKRWLLATPYQVNQIGYQMGYEDISYFTRFFKKQTGYSPEAFRNNFK
ncbi:AraC family transcriptional activator of pobA [Mucilaginibacter sp. UYNi724]